VHQVGKKTIIILGCTVNKIQKLVPLIHAILYQRTFFLARQPPCGTGPSHCRGFTITLRHTTLCRTPLEEWSARRRDLYPYNTHNTLKRQTSMPPGGFEPVIRVSALLQIHAFDFAATGIGSENLRFKKKAYVTLVEHNINVQRRRHFCNCCLTENISYMIS